MSRSWVEVDLEAVRANARAILRFVDGPDLCAVVKADGYGHGAVEVARAAVDAGAAVLAVAQVDEGVQLRQVGLEAPIWVLSEPDPTEFALACAFDLEPVVYSAAGIAAAEVAAASSAAEQLRVHLKIDTGMHRVGARPEDAVARASQVADCPNLVLGSVLTHCAVGDEPENPFTDTQMDRFDSARQALATAGLAPPLAHAANSGATLAFPRTHLDVVRCGIALYGLTPSAALAERIDLQPALRWVTNVGFVKELGPGDRVSYGQRGLVEQPTRVATLPVGYADGYRRATWEVPGVVLIGGRRCDILGVVTMDQIVIDVGDLDVAPGDEAVLIGRQGSEAITAEHLAEGLGTINYEITCGLSSRVERRYVDSKIGR